MPNKPSLHPIDAGKTPDQLLSERTQRLTDAVQMKQPDRIPVFMYFGNLLAELGGVTRQSLYEDPEKAHQLMEAAMQRFQPDWGAGVYHTPNPSMALGDRMTKWPGYGLGPDGSYQFVEREYMKASDYDAFIEDPADWAIRVYTPRVFKNLEGLAMLPPLGMWGFGYYNTLNYQVLTAPPLMAAFEAIHKAAQAQAQFLQEAISSAGRLAALGFPPLPFVGYLVEAPFDFMSDTMRGMRGIFLDMMRIPDKLIAAQEKVKRFEIEYAVGTAAATGMNDCFIPMHRGADGFMSLAQFEKFYWPKFKELVLALVDNGITPYILYEGKWDDRLEYLAQFPKGKTVGFFQNSDIVKVKEILGDTMCIGGGMPNSMLVGGSPEQIREHTHRLCEEVGEGGGFIFCTNAWEMEGSKPELVQAWSDAIKEYGVY
jgi:uroporphyrinogen-III decarboxylase